MSVVIVWSKPACVQCKAVYRKLDKHGVEYEIRNLPDFPEKLAEFKAAGLMQAPVTEAEGFETFAGNNPDILNAIAERYGTK